MTLAIQRPNKILEQYVWKIPRRLPEGFLPFNIPEHAKKAAATEWYKQRLKNALLPMVSLKSNTDIFDIVISERVMEQVCELVIKHCSKGVFAIFHTVTSQVESQNAYCLFLSNFIHPLISRLRHLNHIRPSALEIVLCDPKCIHLLLDSGHNLIGMAEMALCSESFAFQTSDRFLSCSPRDHLVLKTILCYQAQIGQQMLSALVGKLNMSSLLERIDNLKNTIINTYLSNNRLYPIDSLLPSELYPYVCPTLVVPYIRLKTYNALFGLATSASFDRLLLLAEMIKAKLINIMSLGHAGALLEVNLLLFDIGIHFEVAFDERFIDSLRQLNLQKTNQDDESELQNVYPYDPDLLKSDNGRRNRVFMKYFVTRHIYEDLYKHINNIIERKSPLPEKYSRLRGAIPSDNAPRCVWQSLSWLATLLVKVCELLNLKDPQYSAVFKTHTSTLLDSNNLHAFLCGETIHQASMNVYCNTLTGKFNTLFNY